MGRVVIRVNNVMAIETRKGLYVIAQSLGHGTIMFFNLFTTDPSAFLCDLETAERLCCVTAIRNFFDNSHIIKLKIKPASDLDKYKYENRLAFQLTDGYGFKKFTLYGKTEDELTVSFHAGELRLVDSKLQTIQLLDKIQDREAILSHRLETTGVYGELNERLYLSWLCGRCVEPMKDLLLGITPIEYKVFFQILSGQISEAEWRSLPIEEISVSLSDCSVQVKNKYRNRR